MRRRLRLAGRRRRGARRKTPAPASPQERKREREEEREENDKKKPDKKKNFPTTFSETRTTKISKNIGKYSTNQNKNQRANRKPKFAPENGTQNAAKRRGRQKKTSFPGEKNRRRQTRKRSKTLAKHRSDKQTKINFQEKLGFVGDPACTGTSFGENL